MDYKFKRVSDSINLSEFNCGNSKDHKKLNNFLKNHALPHQEDFIGTTLVVFDADVIVGYVTLMTGSIELRENRESFFSRVLMSSSTKKKYPTYPAIRLGRLAVDSNYQKKGVGSFLIKLSIAIAYEMNKEVGVRFLVVDSKRMSKDFYLKNGFEKLDDNDDLFMYYDLLGDKNGKTK